MAQIEFTFCGARLRALGSGALHWPALGALCVADLHLGKAQRPALAGGAALPPYEVRETLTRLRGDVQRSGADWVIVLGDGFDDPAAAARLAPADRALLADLMAGRRWTWLMGNHDRGLAPLGAALPALHLQGITLRHIADPAARAEISGHYHPKMRLPGGRAGGRAAFLVDANRIILPAYGAYTGGLWADAAPLCTLMGPAARALLTDPARHAETATEMPPEPAADAKAPLIALPLRPAAGAGRKPRDGPQDGPENGPQDGPQNEPRRGRAISKARPS